MVPLRTRLHAVHAVSLTAVPTFLRLRSHFGLETGDYCRCVYVDERQGSVCLGVPIGATGSALAGHIVKAAARVCRDVGVDSSGDGLL